MLGGGMGSGDTRGWTRDGFGGGVGGQGPRCGEGVTHFNGTSNITFYF